MLSNNYLPRLRVQDHRLWKWKHRLSHWHLRTRKKNPETLVNVSFKCSFYCKRGNESKISNNKNKLLHDPNFIINLHSFVRITREMANNNWWEISFAGKTEEQRINYWLDIRSLITNSCLCLRDSRCMRSQVTSLPWLYLKGLIGNSKWKMRSSGQETDKGDSHGESRIKKRNIIEVPLGKERFTSKLS